MVLRELVRECALEAGEVVFEVREDVLTVVEPERLPCEPTMLDSMTLGLHSGTLAQPRFPSSSES